jgi:hypothetical protein
MPIAAITTASSAPALAPSASPFARMRAAATMPFHGVFPDCHTCFAVSVDATTTMA